MRKFKVKNLNLSTIDISSFAPQKVFVPNFLFNQNFNSLVEVGNEVKMGEKIFEKNGQFIASPISGKVLSIRFRKDFFGDLVYFVEIEANKKNDVMIYQKPNAKNKQELIKLCKDFGLISTNNFVAKIIENFEKTLVINAFDEAFVFNNFVMLKNHSKLIFEVIKKIIKICEINSIVFCTSKTTKSFLKNLILENKDMIFGTKIVIKTKQNLNALNLFDLYNLHEAFCGKMQTNLLVSVLGGALKQNGVVMTSFGTKICDIISFLGGLKQSIDEVEDFKYMSLVAFNDLEQLKQKIKQAKDEESKQKLIELLKEKNKQANDNVFSKREEYYKKYLNCLSCLIVNGKNSKILITDIEKPLEFFCYALSFLNFEEFS